MNEDELMTVMRHTFPIPFGDRNGKRKHTIYESGIWPTLEPSGHFHIDFSAYGGTTEDVPKSLIDRLEAEGKLVRAFSDKSINAWVLP